MTDHNRFRDQPVRTVRLQPRGHPGPPGRNWYEMFEGPDKIYWENDEGLGYVMDTGNLTCAPKA